MFVLRECTKAQLKESPPSINNTRASSGRSYFPTFGSESVFVPIQLRARTDKKSGYSLAILMSVRPRVQVCASAMCHTMALVALAILLQFAIAPDARAQKKRPVKQAPKAAVQAP